MVGRLRTGILGRVHTFVSLTLCIPAPSLVIPALAAGISLSTPRSAATPPYLCTHRASPSVVPACAGVAKCGGRGRVWVLRGALCSSRRDTRGERGYDESLFAREWRGGKNEGVLGGCEHALAELNDLPQDPEVRDGRRLVMTVEKFLRLTREGNGD